MELTTIQIAVASIAAAIVCFFTAMTGSGSGLILVPLLTFLGLSPVQAIAIHKFESTLWTTVSACRYVKSKQVHLLDFWWYLVIGATGTFIGVKLIHLISPQLLSDIVGVAIILVGLWMLFVHTAPEAKEVTPFKRIFLIISMLGFGIYEGTFGSGNGYFIAALFFSVLGTNETKTVGMITTLAAGWNLVAVIGHYDLGSLIFKYAIPIGTGSAVGAWFGAGFAIERGAKFVRWVIIAGSLIAGLLMLLK